jgi:Mn2+/Fe2+ NRAMP family transporter
MVLVSVLLQLVLPMVSLLDDVVSKIPLVGEQASVVLGSHRSNPMGGAFVIALITIIGAFIAPHVCGMINM